jgi:hypothetical protein
MGTGERGTAEVDAGKQPAVNRHRAQALYRHCHFTFPTAHMRAAPQQAQDWKFNLKMRRYGRLNFIFPIIGMAKWSLC